MKKLAIVILIVLLLAFLEYPVSEQRPAIGELSLESQIEDATGIVRSVSPVLQEQATRRVQEIQTDFSHAGAKLAYGQAEIIALNRGFDSPLAQAVQGWLGSPAHAAILLDLYYTQIGCAWDTSPATSDTRETTWLVCWFQQADEPASPVVVVVTPPKIPEIKEPAVTSSTTTTTIPDTAMESPR